MAIFTDNDRILRILYQLNLLFLLWNEDLVVLKIVQDGVYEAKFVVETLENLALPLIL